MIPIIKIKFYLTGENLNFDEISFVTGLKPDIIRKKSEWPLGTIQAGFSKDTWMYEVKEETSWAIATQIEKLYRLLDPKVDALEKLINQYTLKVTVAVIIEMEAGCQPEMLIEYKHLQFLSQIHAELCFDLYFSD